MHKIYSKTNKCICRSLNIFSHRRRRRRHHNHNHNHNHHNHHHKHHHHHHYHHHQLPNVQFCHLLTRSRLTRPEVCLIVSSGSSAFWSSFFSIFVKLLLEHSVYMSQPVSIVFLYFAQNRGYI